MEGGALDEDARNTDRCASGSCCISIYKMGLAGMCSEGRYDHLEKHSLLYTV